MGMNETCVKSIDSEQFLNGNEWDRGTRKEWHCVVPCRNVAAATIAEAQEEGVVVFCIFKDALAVDAAHHDMINSCARLDAAFPWHDTILFGTLTCPLCPVNIAQMLSNCL